VGARSGLLSGRSLGSGLGDLGGRRVSLGAGEELGLPLRQRLGVGRDDLGLLTGAGAATGAGQQTLGGRIVAIRYTPIS